MAGVVIRRSRSERRCEPGCTGSPPRRACARWRTALAACCRPAWVTARLTRTPISGRRRRPSVAGADPRHARVRDAGRHRHGSRHSVRLAVMTALQELPARQRAVLILRPWSVNTPLQRARARLAEVSPTEDDAGRARRCQAPRIARPLLRGIRKRRHGRTHGAAADRRQKLEMPPWPVWFTGRDTVLKFLAARAFTKAGDIVMVPTAANAQPAVAEYRRTAAVVMRAHSITRPHPGCRRRRRHHGLPRPGVVRSVWICRQAGKPSQRTQLHPLR